MKVKNHNKQQYFDISLEYYPVEVKGKIVKLSVNTGGLIFFVHKNKDNFEQGFRVSELTTGLAVTTKFAATQKDAIKMAEEKLSTKTPEQLNKYVNAQLNKLKKKFSIKNQINEIEN